MDRVKGAHGLEVVALLGDDPKNSPKKGEGVETHWDDPSYTLKFGLFFLDFFFSLVEIWGDFSRYFHFSSNLREGESTYWN